MVLKDLRLPKIERLSSLEINSLFNSHKRKVVSSYPLLLIFEEIQSLEFNKFAVGVKGAWKANKRNRIKRLIREIYRLNKFATTKKYKLFFMYLDDKNICDFNSLSKRYAKLRKKFTELTM